MTTRLHQLHAEQGQSPWLDNLRRDWLLDGEMTRWVERGVRGVTSNPSIFAAAMRGGGPYADQLRGLVAGGASIEEAYWAMAVDDIAAALEVLAPVHEASGGEDGFVSLEVDPGLAHDTAGTVSAALDLHARLDAPNLYVKIPATAAGIPAIRDVVAAGHSVNVTLIFGLERYEAVMEAYLSGLEARAGDLSGISSVASFFISRVDTEVDRRLEASAHPDAPSLRGMAAVAQARAAYARFRARFAGPRWDALAARGARRQRPLWASTSTKNPAYPDTLYVDELIGPDTVNTLPDATLAAFLDHGTVSRTVDRDPAAAGIVLARLAEVGIDLADVAEVLEGEGVAAFAGAYDDLLAGLAATVAESRG